MGRSGAHSGRAMEERPTLGYVWRGAASVLRLTHWQEAGGEESHGGKRIEGVVRVWVCALVLCLELPGAVGQARRRTAFGVAGGLACFPERFLHVLLLGCSRVRAALDV